LPGINGRLEPKEMCQMRITGNLRQRLTAAVSGGNRFDPGSVRVRDLRPLRTCPGRGEIVRRTRMFWRPS
jgi:hypothetical protein